MSEERNYEASSVPQGDYGMPNEEQANYNTTDYSQNPYAGTTYTQPVQEPVRAKTGCATAALVFGIFALLTTLFFINYVFGLLSILFGVIYLLKKADIKPKGKVITGLVMSVLSLAISTAIWVSVYNYVVTTNFTDIVEDVVGLTGEEINGDEMMNDIIQSSTGGVMDLEMIENFVGGEVSVERIMQFMDGVTEEDINNFIYKLEYVDPESIPEEFMTDEISYETLVEIFGENFTMRDIFDYVDENLEFKEMPTEGEADMLEAAPAN